MTPHQRRMRELEAMRGLISDLNTMWESATVGTVPSADVAAVFDQHSASLPDDSKVLAQFQRLASMIRRGPVRTRAEGIRQITRTLQRQTEQFARSVEARDSKLRGK